MEDGLLEPLVPVASKAFISRLLLLISDSAISFLFRKFCSSNSRLFLLSSLDGEFRWPAFLPIANGPLGTVKPLDCDSRK